MNANCLSKGICFPETTLIAIGLFVLCVRWLAQVWGCTHARTRTYIHRNNQPASNIFFFIMHNSMESNNCSNFGRANQVQILEYRCALLAEFNVQYHIKYWNDISNYSQNPNKKSLQLMIILRESRMVTRPLPYLVGQRLRTSRQVLLRCKFPANYICANGNFTKQMLIASLIS